MTREEELFMKKIINKLKKVFMGVSSFLILLPIKVYAEIRPDDLGQALYAPPPEENKTISVLKFILTYFRLICMPVILVVGLVIYIKKSEAKRRKKIVVLMITILIYIFIWLWLPIILDFFVEQH